MDPEITLNVSFSNSLRNIAASTKVIKGVIPIIGDTNTTGVRSKAKKLSTKPLEASMPATNINNKCCLETS